METEARDNTAKNAIAGMEGAYIQKQAHKKWDDCPIEEKIERLRNEQLEARWTLRRAYDLGRKAWRVVCNHQHNAATGKVLQTIDEHGLDKDGEAMRHDQLA